MHRLQQRSSSSTRITIEQRVPSDTVKKGPHSIKRTVDPNDLVIKRRFGEGTKPLFDRADIKVNHLTSTHKKSPPKSYRRARSPSSTSSSETERYSKVTNSKSSPVSKSRTESRSRLIEKKRTPEKVPYFIDHKRERERLQRKQSTVVKKSSPNRYKTKTHRRSRTKTRSRSPNYRRYHNSDRRPPSGDRYSRSRHRPRSRSRSRSRNRSEREHERYITIPVPIEVPYAAYMPPVNTYPPMPQIRYPGQPPIRYPFIMGHSLPPPVHYPIRYPMRLPRYPQYPPRSQFRQRNQ